MIHLSADYNEKQIKSVGFSGNDFVIKPKDTMDVKVSIAFLDEAEPGKDKITIYAVSYTHLTLPTTERV